MTLPFKANMKISVLFHSIRYWKTMNFISLSVKWQFFKFWAVFPDIEIFHNKRVEDKLIFEFFSEIFHSCLCAENYALLLVSNGSGKIEGKI